MKGLLLDRLQPSAVRVFPNGGGECCCHAAPVDG